MTKMNTGKLLLVLAAMLLAVGGSVAQDTGAGREADHAALRNLMANVTQAINSQDMDKVASYFTKDFVFTTVDQAILTNTLSLKNYYDRMLHQKDSPVTSYQMAPKADIPTLFLDADKGFVYGISDDIYTLRINGRKVPMTCHWTATVVKENGVWKMAAVHSGVNVMKNPVIDTIVGSMWRNLLIAVCIGALVGFGIGFLVAKRLRKAPVK